MNDGIARHRSAGTDNPMHGSRRRNAPPERWALWAVLLAFVAMAAAAASAHAASTGGAVASGGVGTPDSAPFGTRVLSEGMEGSDVKILNGIVKSKPYASGVHLTDSFDSATASAVEQFQGSAGLDSNGVVGKSTKTALVRSMPKAGATWYDLSGRSTACGVKLTPNTIGVAHKTLPCGTKVTFAYHGRYVIAPVIDRGPYSPGNTWDLTIATADALGFTSSGADDVRYSVAQRGSDARRP
jgi:rare lipoprotein A (peptidoglycan hydrolase)